MRSKSYVIMLVLYWLCLLSVAVIALNGIVYGALVQTSGEQVTSGGMDVIAYGPPDFTDAPLCTGPTVEGRKLATTSGTLYDDSATSYASALAGVQFRVADDASGTNAAIAAETVTGYITIKDSGGTSRKIAVVS